MGSRAESIVVGSVGLYFWAIKFIMSEHFKKIDRKVVRQHQILLQGIKAGYDFKQTVMQNMYTITNELWKRSIWIAMNWNSLWPGMDGDLELRKEFDANFEEYYKFRSSNSINIPSHIFTAAGKLIEGIDTYKNGRMVKSDKSFDAETRREGHKNMSSGTRLIKSSMKDLFRAIREEFGLERLPGDVLNIPVPEESQSKTEDPE